MELKKSAISGIKWSTVAQIGKQVLQFITLIILARLLDPSDFGLMASAIVVIGFANVFRDLGISSAIIQKQEVSIVLFSSLFWLSVLLGVLIMLILILFSSSIAAFFNVPKLASLLNVLALSFFFSGFSIVQQAVLEKKMKFKNLAILELSATFFASLAGIILALLRFGVWSLVIQNVFFSFILSILILSISPIKPKFIISIMELKSVFNFSANLAGFNILNYFVRNADYILIQKFLGEQQLGYYSLAYRIMLYPLQNITSVVSRVMFPVLSKIQDDNENFRAIYMKLINSIALITFPLMLGLISVNDTFVVAVFGLKWEPIINLIYILVPLGLIQSIYTPAGIIYQVKGRTDWWFRWGLFTGVLFFIAFWMGVKWGIVGVALAYLTMNIITFYPGLAIPFKLIKLKVLNFVVSLNTTLLISVIMFGIVFLIKIYLNLFFTQKISLFVSIFIGIVTYLLLSIKYNNEKIKYVFESIKS